MTETTTSTPVSTAPVIPDNINELNRFQAAQFYVEQLGWPIIPLYGPNQGRGTEPGKRIVISGWKEHRLEDSTPEFLAKYFDPKKPYNLGLLVAEGFVHVDLDAKADQGASVREWLAGKRELAKVPRERTGGGAHLVFRCDDLPEDLLLANSPAVSRISDEIMAEMMIPGLPLAVSPSVHRSGHQYRWEVTGEIPVVCWEDLRSWFGFEVEDAEAKKARSKKRRSREWLGQWKGDLRTLNLVAVLEEVDLLGECLDPDNEKWSIRCPWQSEHSDSAAFGPDSSTVIFNPPEHLPGFSCLHSHCNGRKFEELAGWIETHHPGLIEAHCSRKRAYDEGQKTQDGRPRILLPDVGRPDSEFAEQVGKVIGPHEVWFNKANSVCSVELREISEKIKTLVFCPIQPVEAVTAAEVFVETGVLVKGPDKDDEPEFAPKSMSRETAAKLIAAPQFKKQLPGIIRILDIPLPIATGGEILIPERGYDARFRSYLEPTAPEPVDMSLERALEILHDVHSEFCWKNEQSVTHALARMITPYCRGLMGWDARIPLWHFAANRPRAGKDYLAGATHIVYEGRTCEDAPIDRDSEETRKRITAGLMSGQRIMHFANCQGFIQDPHFIGAITSKTFAARNLGSTEAKADLVLPNEIEFSLSANIGLSFREDVEPRTRRISLEFYDENPNGRSYQRPDLHGWLAENRALVLGAIAALVQHWIGRGCPPGPTPFNSFPEWARVVGGIMTACGLGDPCLTHEGNDELGGDRVEQAMRAVYQVGFNSHPDEWIAKADLFELLEEAVDDHDALGFFAVGGDLSSRDSKTRIGKALRRYKGRELGGVQLAIDENGKGQRQQVKFAQPTAPEPVDLGHVFGKVGKVRKVYVEPDVESLSKGKREPSIIEEDKVQSNRERSHPSAPSTPEIDSVLCRDHSALEEVATDLHGRDRIALDIETYGPKPKGALDPWRGEVRLLTLSRHAGPVWLLDLKAIGYDLGPLKPILEDAEIVAHNAKFDLLWLREKCGLTCRRVFCTMTASRLINAGFKLRNRLDDCLHRYLDVEPGPDHSRSDWSSPLLTPDQINYAARDVAYLHDLAGALESDLEMNGLEEVWALEKALLPCVVKMESAGIGVDRKKLESLATREEQTAAEAAESLRNALEAPDLNPGSASQLRTALRAAGFKVKSTKEAELKKADDGKIVPLVLRYRESIKRAQQAESFLGHIASDGRIHGRFEPTGTDTGRFSSKEPNLQNIGRGELREAFVPAPGCKFVVADYSQVELRAAAAIAGEEKMIEAYRDGTDLHRLTAAAVLKIDLAEVGKEERQLAKAVNFGLLYGQSAPGLSRDASGSYGVDLSPDDARTIRNRFFGNYRSLRHWQVAAHQQAKTDVREVRTRLGRRRRIPYAASEWERFTALVNTPVQGGTADGMKQALVLAAERLPENARLIATVHDELVVECPEDQAEPVREILITAMTEAMAALFPEVPIEVEASVCSSWAEK